MSWRDLLTKPERRILPWIGGDRVRYKVRSWKLLADNHPREHGWFEFELLGMRARYIGAPRPDARGWIGTRGVGYEGGFGYLVGDRFVADDEGGEVETPEQLAKRFPRVHLIEPGLDHFDRVVVRRFWDDGPLIYVGQEFPTGAEAEALDAFVERRLSLAELPHVPPALDLAFRMKVRQRDQVERRRAEERARREAEERRRRIAESLGDGALRREVAKQDFETAAKAALALGGAEYLEHRRAPQEGEFVVRYRLDGRRLECTCNEAMRIISAGICLTDEDTGEKGDSYLTLESLPGVVREAEREDRLVVWRHV